MTPEQEIREALEALGYEDPDFKVVEDGVDRYVVTLVNIRFGIWDAVKKTFVD